MTLQTVTKKRWNTIPTGHHEGPPEIGHTTTLGTIQGTGKTLTGARATATTADPQLDTIALTADIQLAMIAIIADPQLYTSALTTDIRLIMRTITAANG